MMKDDCITLLHHRPPLPSHNVAFLVLLDEQEKCLVHGVCDVSSKHSSSDSEIASPCRLNPITKIKKKKSLVLLEEDMKHNDYFNEVNL
jgi:hypothetical protein